MSLAPIMMAGRPALGSAQVGAAAGGTVAVTDDDADAAMDLTVNMLLDESIEHLENEDDALPKVSSKPVGGWDGPYVEDPGYRVKVSLPRRSGPFDYADFVQPLFNVIGEEGINSIQSIGTEGNSCDWYIVVSTMAVFNKLITAGQMLIRGKMARVEDPSNMYVTGNLFWLPDQYPDRAVVDTLAKYVEVVNITRQHSSNNTFGHSRTGVRTVTFKTSQIQMREEGFIPHVIYFHEYESAQGAYKPRGLFTFPGRKPICLRCHETGHMAKQCRAWQCRHCGKLGHRSEECYYARASKPSYADILRERPDMLDEPQAHGSNDCPPSEEPWTVVQGKGKRKLDGGGSSPKSSRVRVTPATGNGEPYVAPEVAVPVPLPESNVEHVATESVVPEKMVESVPEPSVPEPSVPAGVISPSAGTVASKASNDLASSGGEPKVVPSGKTSPSPRKRKQKNKKVLTDSITTIPETPPETEVVSGDALSVGDDIPVSNQAMDLSPVSPVATELWPKVGDQPSSGDVTLIPESEPDVGQQTVGIMDTGHGSEVASDQSNSRPHTVQAPQHQGPKSTHGAHRHLPYPSPSYHYPPSQSTRFPSPHHHHARKYQSAGHQSHHWSSDGSESN